MNATAKAIQSALGVTADGIIGAKTLAEMDTPPPLPHRLHPPPRLMVGMGIDRQ